MEFKLLKIQTTFKNHPECFHNGVRKNLIIVNYNSTLHKKGQGLQWARRNSQRIQIMIVL